MIQDLSNKIITRYPRKTTRLFEILPPLTAIFLIIMPFWASYVIPMLLSYFIIFFDVYWLYKSINIAVFSFISAKKISEAERIDWLSKAKALPNFSKVNHIAVIPNYKERVEKLRETVESLKRQTFPAKNIYVVLAMEAREEKAKEKAELLKKEYGKVFGGVIPSYHPDLPNEVKGKSSNEAYGAHVAYKELIEKKKLDINFMTISSVDADSIFDKNYFSCVTYKFLTSPAPHLRFWQSATVYYNNFWQVPSFTRVISFFGSLWRTALLVQGLKLISNSTYTLSFKLLKDIGFWDVDVIPEDYRVFFKAFFKTEGKVEVEPVYLKTSMDAPQSPTYAKSLMNKYSQERRWSWGISDDATYLKWYFTVKNVPFFKKTYLIGNVLMDHILWPVNWFIITISANLVAILNPVFTRTTLGYNLPRLSGFILTLCLFGLFALIFVDYNLRSKHYSKTSKLRQFLFPLEFIFMPIAGFFLSAFPALISHIQLILGKRMEYKVTEKV